MSVASPPSRPQLSRTSIEISPELKPHDLSSMLREARRSGSKEVFLFAKDDRVYMTSDHRHLQHSQPEKSSKLISLIKRNFEDKSIGSNLTDILRDIRTIAKPIKVGKNYAGVRREENYVAVGTRELSGLLSSRHDPLAQLALSVRGEIIDASIMECIGKLHVLCAAHAELAPDGDSSKLDKMAGKVGLRIGSALVETYEDHRQLQGKRPLDLFRLSFLTDDIESVRKRLHDLCRSECSHLLSDAVIDKIIAGLQEEIGNARADSEPIVTKGSMARPLPGFRLNGMRFHLADKQAAGEGGHGCVHIYRSTDGNHTVAVKSPLDKEAPLLETYAHCQHELSLHLQAQGIGHENVVEVMGALRLEDRLYIMMEDCSLGSLDKFLQHQLPPAAASDKLDHPEFRLVALTLARDVLRGLEHLHDSSGALHLDMKPANVFLGVDGKAKLGDFDLSMKGSAIMRSTDDLPATAQYLSPRLLAAQTRVATQVKALNDEESNKLRAAAEKHEKKAIIKASKAAKAAIDRSVELNWRDDVYAAGVTLFEIFYGVNPFLVSDTGTGTVNRVEAYAAATSKRQRHQLLFDGHVLPQALADDEDVLQSLLMALLDPAELARPSAAEAAQHRLFADKEIGSGPVRAAIVALRENPSE